jgi:PmbA protein
MSMNTNEKYSLADQAIEHALKNGAEQVSVVIDDNRSTSIEIRDQKIDSLKESNQNGFTISLYTENKYSSHFTNRMNKADVLKFIDEAIIATRYLASDEFRALPDPGLYYKGGGPDLSTFDSKLDSVDAKIKIDLANNVHNEAFKKDSRIISVSAYYSDNINNRVMVTSNGFRGDTANTYVSLSASVSVKSDSGRPSDYWYENSLNFDKLTKTGIGEKALERTIKKIGPKKIASGKYRVLIENRVASRICGPVFQSLQGGNLYNKQSFLTGKTDKPIGSEILSVYDDPAILSGSGSRLFDEEGFAAIKRPVIENGVLKSYYIDNYYAKKLGMKPTSGSSSNVIFKTGNRTANEMLESMKKGVFITGFIGGNSNGSTGDFSFGIEGYYIEDGKIIHPVNEMNIAGNMSQFWFNLVETGNDFMENESVRIPSLMFDNIDLSGL